MSTATVEQEDRTDKKGTLKLKDGTQVLGTIKAESTGGILLQLKGKQKTVLYLDEKIESFTVSDEVPVVLKASRVKPITSSTVKRHLLNAHGKMLSEVNEKDEDDCLEWHEDLHKIHKGDIGHIHSDADDATDEPSE